MRLHPNDNVGLALTKIKENCSLDNIIAQENIPAGQKIALVEIQKGEAVRKYNQTIGFASQTIHAGDHVHTHNIEMLSFERSHQSVVVQKNKNSPKKKSDESASFQGLFTTKWKGGNQKLHRNSEYSKLFGQHLTKNCRLFQKRI